MHQLVVYQPNRPPQPVGLDEGCLTIGRAVDNLLVLDDPSVQPHHALVMWDEPGHRLCALDPLHPPTVNGMPVNDHVLRLGDVIRVGQIELRYEAVPVTSIGAGESVHRLFDRRGPWIGVTVVASVVSAAVTFLLTSRVPDRAIEVAAPRTAEARPTTASTVSHRLVWVPESMVRDGYGRFICKKLPGWSWEQREEGLTSELTFRRGYDEVRLRVQPAGQRRLEPVILADNLRTLGNVRQARWRQWAGGPAVEVELERIETPAQWVRVVKMRRGAWDHVVALYVGDRDNVAGTVQTFEDWLASYRVIEPREE
ncbi:MAG: FHA domain-containing protein [Verrucomicrobiae bacterium]|nr:FHA domain-containing protein [Verrucomicrobiae bacterium]